MKIQTSESSCGVDRFMKKEKKSKKRKSWIQRAQNNINDLSQEGNRNKKTNATYAGKGLKSDLSLLKVENGNVRSNNFRKVF